jgi:nuclear GTP-binding protein
VENVQNPEQYITGVLKRTQSRHIERTYNIKGYADATDFLNILARKGGRLLRGGEPDVNGVAKMVINDFLRGKIPWFTPAPHVPGSENDKFDGREGRLGEMARKRKRDDPTVASQASDRNASLGSGSETDEAEFEGFDDEENSDSG